MDCLGKRIQSSYGFLKDDDGRVFESEITGGSVLSG